MEHNLDHSSTAKQSTATKTIKIRLAIPLSDEDWGGQCVTFYRWIPEGDADAIVIKNESREISITIDKACVSALGEVTDELINKWVNISVVKINVEVVAKDIDACLAGFIFDERESPREIHHGLAPGEDGYEHLKERYKSLGIEVAEIALDAFNRVLSYARNVKGQYGLSEHSFDRNQLTSLNNRFRAQAKIEDGEWFRWCPPCIDSLVLHMESDEVAIRREDWSRVSEFVASSNRPNLVFELVANSHQLFNGGHMRSSVIEAVSALEVAVSKFGGKANIELLSTIVATGRIDIGRLGVQIKHLGLSGSIKYLIPLLFPEDVIPASVLHKCYQALEVRNNVVHQGQRDVSSDLVREILWGATSFCRILDKYTLK